MKDILLSDHSPLTEVVDDNETTIRQEQKKVFPAIQIKIIGLGRTAWGCGAIKSLEGLCCFQIAVASTVQMLIKILWENIMLSVACAQRKHYWARKSKITHAGLRPYPFLFNRYQLDKEKT
ncbi:MAG: hypothetical protein IK129_02640 [Deltaproteobacteria bacterium]|nr:hypothetical protein [Deltaproteobacteria bacterium]